jgi:hypothetical protein
MVQLSLSLGQGGPARHLPWAYVPRGLPGEAYLRACEHREQLQRVCRTWVAAGRPSAGMLLDRMTHAALAHMKACLTLGL